MTVKYDNNVKYATMNTYNNKEGMILTAIIN